ncbi:MAG: hypothetical protein [Caudoviricetes sp.]|nr:MAG: hypothetical protein [Caudoviricetes sp.]
MMEPTPRKNSSCRRYYQNVSHIIRIVIDQRALQIFPFCNFYKGFYWFSTHLKPIKLFYFFVFQTCPLSHQFTFIALKTTYHIHIN